MFWVFAFPVIMTCALGIAFRSRGAEPVIAGVVEQAGADEIAAALEQRRRLHRAPRLPPADVERALRDGRAPVVVVPGHAADLSLRRGARREPGGAAGGRRGAAAGGRPRRRVRAGRSSRCETVGSRYIDWLVPGLLGMNIMGTGMWGVGFAIVKARTKKLLKRLVATPMSKRTTCSSHVLSRLVFLVARSHRHRRLRLGRRSTSRCTARSWALAALAMLGALAFGGLGLLRGQPRADDRSGVGTDEPGDAADVGAVGRVLRVDAIFPTRCSRSFTRCR